MKKSVERQLYEALVALVAHPDFPHDPKQDREVQAARAAIEAYRGRQFAGRGGHSADRREA